MVYHLRIFCIQTTMSPFLTVAEGEVEYTSKDNLLVGLWFASLLGHGVQLFGMVMGASLRSLGTNVYSGVCSTLGGVFV